MRLLAASSVVLAASLTCVFGGLASGVQAQDPSRDLPAARVPGVTANDALRLGVERLQAGWNWEAARMFRELHVRDEDQPIPRLLLALAMREVPNRAARLCFDAVARRDNTDAAGKQLLDAYQTYFGVTDQPELDDVRFQKAPDAKRHLQLLQALRKIGATGSIGELAGRLLKVEAARSVQLAAWQDKQRTRALAAHHGYLSQHALMPFMVPGYAKLFESSQLFRVAGSGVNDDAFDSRDYDLDLRNSCMARLPRHPHHATASAPVRMLPGLKLDQAAPAGATWRPRTAKPFELPRGAGGTAELSDYTGKPVLVIFFLGFGCAHCVAQLSDLDPKAPMFRDAGIEVVTIGTDDLNAVKAARQAADENGVDPLHFDVLCDPKANVFKQWGVWDEFADEALHGTFLLDGLGRILWQDVSARPFEESDWLLAESKRLLAAWKADPE